MRDFIPPQGKTAKDFRNYGSLPNAYEEYQHER